MNANDPAFPVDSDDCHRGITNRQLIAAILCAGMNANPYIAQGASEVSKMTPEECRIAYSESAVKQADELIKALNK